MKADKVTALAALALLVFGGAIAMAALGRTGKVPQATTLTHGFEKETSISDLAANSDLVVRGIVVSTAHEARQVPNREDPPGESRPQVTRTKEVVTSQFRVSEYLKGPGPAVVNVFQSRQIDGSVEDNGLLLREGGEYVLFLFSTEGDPFWGDGYIIQGPTQGHWQVNGEEVTRPFGRPTTMPIRELRAEVARP